MLTCLNTGIIQIYTPEGALFKEFESGHEPMFCASLYSPDEIIIGSLDNKYLRIFTISTNKTANYPTTLSADVLLFDNSDIKPTAFTQYIRLGKKQWIVGDSIGNITVVLANGEILGRANGKVGPIQFFDKSGQQLVYAGKNKISIFNTGSLEPGVMCENTISNILDISLDISPSIIFASLENGDIIVYDTRYSISNGPAYCKPVYRLVSTHPGKIATIKGNLLLIASNILTAFNTSFLEIDAISVPQHFSLPITNTKLIKSYKNNNIISVLISTENEIRVYDIFAPIIIPQNQNGFGIDFSYVRIIVIALAVIFIVVWKSKGRKSKRELEVEKLEQSLAELQKSMESTSKISEDLTTRFKNVEESTKHLSGIRELRESDSD